MFRIVSSLPVTDSLRSFLSLIFTAFFDS
jgi:hypothetical protein